MKIALLINRENFVTYAPPAPEGWEFVHLGNGEPDPDKLAAVGADVLVVDAIMKIGPDILEAVPKLKLVHSQGVAYNGIDLASAARAGVYVCNNAGVNAQAVAEQAVLLMLALLRKFRPYEDMVYAGRQMEAKTACFKNGLPELGAMRVGIVGLGAIGRATAERLAAFGCRLGYYSRTKKPESAIDYLALEELYASSDIISLHVPVTPETVNMINDETLKHFKPGAILINTARGELVDHEAAARAILSGQLGGYGSDTLAPEPVAADNPFLTALPAEYRARVALSPHIAGITAGCFIRAYETIFSNIAAISRGERPRCIVNGI
jgi:lactate dehydrogenase-like 2-hydroxyacid dehydrogenase